MVVVSVVVTLGCCVETFVKGETSWLGLVWKLVNKTMLKLPNSVYYQMVVVSVVVTLGCCVETFVKSETSWLGLVWKKVKKNDVEVA